MTCPAARRRRLRPGIGYMATVTSLLLTVTLFQLTFLTMKSVSYSDAVTSLLLSVTLFQMANAMVSL